MDRKLFIRNTLMALAVSLLPKNLLPVSGEIVEEEYYGFDGIIPAIERNREFVMYCSQEFKDDFNKYIRQLGEINKVL